jgi:hypothetical protein
LKIRRLGLPETRIEIDLADVGATVNEFQAIGEEPAKFVAFVNARGVLGWLLHKN